MLSEFYIRFGLFFKWELDYFINQILLLWRRIFIFLVLEILEVESEVDTLSEFEFISYIYKSEFESDMIQILCY